MNGPEQPRPQGVVEDMKQGLSLIRILLDVLSYPIDVWVRRPGSCGRECHNPLVVLIALFLLPAMFLAVIPPYYGYWWYAQHWGLLVVLTIIHTVGSRKRRGEHVHRQYIGDAWLGKGRSRIGELVLGLILSAVGFALCNALGALLLVSSIASHINVQLILARDQRKLELMRDSQLEAQYYGNRFHHERD